MNKEKYCSESHPVRVGDLLNLFSDSKGILNFDVELSDGDASDGWRPFGIEE